MQKERQLTQKQEQQGKSSPQRYEFIWKNLQDYQISESQIQKYKEYMNERSIDLALGSMFGALIGDALGSFLQFRYNISELTVDEAMKMPGHGTFDLQPGQFTDDSEMASHLLKALMKFDPKKSLDQQEKGILVQIAKQYSKWFLSGPFDIGITTRTALDQISYQLKKQQSQSVLFQKLGKAFQIIKYKNEKSQSNGSLMRITPMAFFVSLLTQKTQNHKEEQITFEGLRNLIKGEISMTHGNPAIYESSQAWVYLLVSMILRQEKPVNEVYNQFQKIYSTTESKSQDQQIHVKGWIQDSKSGEMDARISMGWAKIAFTYGLRHLRDLAKDSNQANFENPLTYKRIIRSILSKKGDTDTNAAIVGGLIGAVIGFKNLPIEYLKTQFQLRLSQSIAKSSRAPQYEPRQLFYNALQIIEKLKNSSNKAT